MSRPENWSEGNAIERPSLLIVHHFFHPDDVVSAVHFAQFASGMAKRGWRVTVLTSNRSCRVPGRSYLAEETWEGVRIIRVYRPNWDQARPVTRLLNSVWLMTAWVARTLQLKRFDAAVVGSDPAFVALMFPVLRSLRRARVLAHWCYDVFPDAIVADRLWGLPRSLAGGFRRLMGRAYRAVDLLVDVGSCMRQRLVPSGGSPRRETLVPWALSEPDSIPVPDAVTRSALFGEARLGLLYSGNLGRAHRYEVFLDLARACRAAGVDAAFCFACRGYRADELRRAVAGSNANVRLAPFISEEALERHLGAADVHLISLKPEWSGLVVPSKFFGSLAVGRPVLYDGPEDSAIATWIRELGVGAVLTSDNVGDVMTWLDQMSRDPEGLKQYQRRAFCVYHEQFNRDRIVDAWDRLMHEQLAEKAEPGYRT